MENIQNKITLIKNGISDVKNKIMELEPVDHNFGGQKLKLTNKSKDSSNKYLVETITFDDMIDFFPKQSTGERYHKVIIKIDIEGFEALAFKNSRKFFKNFDVLAIYIEWEWLYKYAKEMQTYINEMIDLFDLYGLVPCTIDKKRLDKNEWMKWQMLDVIWIKNNCN